MGIALNLSKFFNDKRLWRWEISQNNNYEVLLKLCKATRRDTEHYFFLQPNSSWTYLPQNNSNDAQDKESTKHWHHIEPHRDLLTKHEPYDACMLCWSTYRLNSRNGIFIVAFTVNFSDGNLKCILLLLVYHPCMISWSQWQHEGLVVGQHWRAFWWSQSLQILRHWSQLFQPKAVIRW